LAPAPARIGDHDSRHGGLSYAGYLPLSALAPAIRAGSRRWGRRPSPIRCLQALDTLAARPESDALRLVREQIAQIEAARLERLEEPGSRPHAMVRLLARVVGIGVETADMLVHEVLSRELRDRRAVARYAGLTGSPDESGARRREKGLAKAGNARVRRGMIQLAWRFLLFQKDSALARWYRARTADARGGTRKAMIVALARKLLLALWRLVTTGETPEGLVLRPAG
jgi:transposase